MYEYLTGSHRSVLFLHSDDSRSSRHPGHCLHKVGRSRRRSDEEQRHRMETRHLTVFVKLL